jgi:hypothetical protein
LNIATALISGNGRFDVATFTKDGDAFLVFVKQSPSECRAGRLSIYIKANSEKACRIGFYQDTGTTEELREYVSSELIDAE